MDEKEVTNAKKYDPNTMSAGYAHVPIGQKVEPLIPVINADGCTINISDVYPGKQWADLTKEQKDNIRDCHAWVNGPDLADCHLPYKDPKTGTVKPNCARNALARLNQVSGLSGAEAAAVEKKLQKALKKANKQEQKKQKREGRMVKNFNENHDEKGQFSEGDGSGGTGSGTISGTGGAGYVPEIEYTTNDKGIEEPLVSKAGLKNMGADFKEAEIKSPLADPNEDTLAATTKALNTAAFSDRYTTLYRVTKQFHQKATEDQIKKLGEKGVYFMHGTRETLGDGVENTLNIWGLSIKTKGGK